MADPWAEFRVQAESAADPWAAFRTTQAAPAERGVWDKLTGATGPRYQTWPEKLVRGVASGAVSAATLPGDVLKEATGPQPTQMSDSDVSALSVPRVMDMASFGTPVNPAVRAGDKAIPGVSMAMRPDKPIIPTTKELFDEGVKDIKAGKRSELRISPQTVADYSKKVQNNLFNGDDAIHPLDASNSSAKLKELEIFDPQSSFTPRGLQTFREHLGTTAQNFNDKAVKDQVAASRGIKEFDKFLRDVDPASVVVGAPSSLPATKEQLVAQALTGKREANRVADLFERGRGNYAAAQRSNDITGELDRAFTGIAEQADLAAQVANSGRNFDALSRGKVAQVIKKPKDVSGLTDEEIAAFAAHVKGGSVRNKARYIGNLGGGGGGMGQTVATGIGAGAGAAAGSLIGSPVLGALAGAAIPAGVGAGARTVANALARRSLNKLDETMRMRSPLYQERVANPTMSAVSPEKRAMIARILMQMGLDQEQPPLR